MRPRWARGQHLHWQFLKYALVGFGSNVVLYILYLLITNLGIGHKSAVSVLYLIGVLQTFLFNRSWTFDYKGRRIGTFWRYMITYATGYLVNISMLVLLVDKMGLPHQIVQAVLIIVIAAGIFGAQRLWVFRKDPDADFHREQPISPSQQSKHHQAAGSSTASHR